MAGGRGMKQREFFKGLAAVAVVVTAAIASHPHAERYVERATLKVAPKSAEAAKAPAEKANASAPCLKVGESWKGWKWANAPMLHPPCDAK